MDKQVKDKTHTLIVAHLIYRFDVGGLERVMVNCINAMQDKNIKHVVIALTEVSDFSKHLHQSVQVYQLNKKAGKDLSSHWRLFKLLRQIKPNILHTYNLAAIEYHPVASLAGVKGHIHAEHGRDFSDPEGLNTKHNLLRRLMSPFIDYYVSVSKDLAVWLDEIVGISNRKITLIRNCIDTNHFYRGEKKPKHLSFIHIARLNPVKDQKLLLSAFAKLVFTNNLTVQSVSLKIVGDGELSDSLKAHANSLNITDFVEFAGTRNDIAALLASADVFVLSSIAEGIPMTVLEAMAASLPVISTDVGGLSELINNGVTGYLVPKQDDGELAKAMKYYIDDEELAHNQGAAARLFIDENFSVSVMLNAYEKLYQQSVGNL